MVTLEQTSRGAVGDPFDGPVDENRINVPPGTFSTQQSAYTHTQQMPVPPTAPQPMSAGAFNLQPMQDTLPDHNPYRQLQKQRTGQSEGSFPGQTSYLSTSAGATTGRPGTAPYLPTQSHSPSPQVSTGFVPTPPSSYHATAPRSHSVSAVSDVVPQTLHPLNTSQDGVFHMEADRRQQADPFGGQGQSTAPNKSAEWWESPISSGPASPESGKPHISLEEQLENEFHRGKGSIAQQPAAQIAQAPVPQPVQQPIQFPIQYPVPPIHQPLQLPVPQAIPQPPQQTAARFSESADPFGDASLPPKPPTPPKIPHAAVEPSLLDDDIRLSGTDKEIDTSAQAPIPVNAENALQSATGGTVPPAIPLETYQIKHIRFLDPATNKLAQSSILIQNENGPCPLIALVNVMSLSRESLVLSEGLRIRETLSLELLLNVVCEELVLTGSWTGDLSELFKFLMNLRTGMNVNPKFVNDEIKAEDFLRSRNVLENRPLPQPKPGDFEQTRELILYSAFNIPLVHGWLPAPTSPMFPVLVQHARDFEKAQDIIIQQQFILEKGSRGEQVSAEDNEIVAKAHEIQDFLEVSGTQMTSYGLNVLQTKLAPGSWSIFFRNDHFSTLYKHARTGDLFTLVTDSGYATYEEIVWESLVDASGRGGEYFSGDFRPVGQGHGGSGAHSVSQRQSDNILDPSRNEGGWTPQVQPRRSSLGPPPGIPVPRRQVQSLIPPESTPIIPPDAAGDTTDYDLALAIHLQQEEDERAARTRQNRQNLDPSLVQNLASANQPPVRSLVSSQPTGVRPRASSGNYRPTQPPRPQGRQAQELRNAANEASGQEEIPPPYAAADPNPTAFTPQPDSPAPGSLARHSSFPTGRTDGVGSFSRQGQGSAYSQMNSLYGQGPGSQYPGAARGRKPSGQPVGSGGDSEDKKCSIM